MVWRPQFVQKQYENFTIHNFIKIRNSVGISFGPRLCTHKVGLNAYFSPREQTCLFQQPTMKYKIQSIILNITGKVTVVQKNIQLKYHGLNVQNWNILMLQLEWIKNIWNLGGKKYVIN